MVVEIQTVFDRGGICELCEPVGGIKQEEGVIEAVLKLLQDSSIFETSFPISLSNLNSASRRGYVASNIP